MTERSAPKLTPSSSALQGPRRERFSGGLAEKQFQQPAPASLLSALSASNKARGILSRFREPWYRPTDQRWPSLRVFCVSVMSDLISLAWATQSTERAVPQSWSELPTKKAKLPTVRDRFG